MQDIKQQEEMNKRFDYRFPDELIRDGDIYQLSQNDEIKRLESKEKCKCLKYHHNKCSKFLENEENTVVKQDTKEERHWCSKDCEYCSSGVNYDPISMFCHLRDEYKQDTTDWATEFDKVFPLEWFSTEDWKYDYREDVRNVGVDFKLWQERSTKLALERRRLVKEFIESVRQKAQQEKTEHLMKYLYSQIQDDYEGCSIDYFLKDQASIMKIDLSNQ